MKTAIITICLIVVAPVVCFAQIDTLLEAQMLALDISGELQPPEELTQRILDDLVAIRAAYPEVAGIHYMLPYAPDEIIVRLTDEAFTQFQQGRYHALDELNALYGVISSRSSMYSPVILLKFDRIYNTEILSDIYEQANPEGLRYAEANYRIGDGSTIYADPPHYTFRRAWGDCPAGCIYSKYWHFKVESGQVSILPITRYVNAATGRNNNHGFTSRAALATIQRAIDLASNGDEVIIAPGTYKGDGNRDIDFLGKAVTVRSIDPNNPDIVAATIIDCNGTEIEPHRGFYFHTEEDANSILAGLTITNGWNYIGGGIYCEADYFQCNRPTITKCVITGNVAAYDGGGIGCDSRSNPSIVDCEISNNLAADGFGGGISCGNMADCEGIIINCIISNNVASGSGGGIAGGNVVITNCQLINNSTGKNGGGVWNCQEIKNCIISGNYAGNEGGGLHLCNLIQNCVITGNEADSGGGISSSKNINNSTIVKNKAISKGGAVLSISVSTRDIETIFTNNITWDNIAPQGSEIYLDTHLVCIAAPPYTIEVTSTFTARYSDIDGEVTKIHIDPNSNLIWSEGNINIDPCFVDSGYWDANGTPSDAYDDFWINGNYHLRPDSPCIDAGDPNYLPEPNERDLDGWPRIIGDRIDMGAYEYQNTPPVANAGPDQTVYAWIDGFADVTLDGSDSNDADGDALTYKWTWTIDANTYEANSVSPTIELPVGVHTIQLVVNDGLVDSAPDDVNITVIAPIQGTLKITPTTINRKSNQPSIQAIIQIPDGIAMRDIDSSEHLILYPGEIKATKQSFAAGNGISADFNKDALMAAVPENGDNELKVAGKLKSGQYFYGRDTVRIIH